MFLLLNYFWKICGERKLEKINKKKKKKKKDETKLIKLKSRNPCGIL
jgi:hypothetical protein